MDQPAQPDAVVDHYAGQGLLAAIEAAVTASAKSPETVTVDELGAVDEFHIGGRVATAELCARLHLGRGDRVLDVGCGIGGTARFIAATTGCSVTGIDISPAFVSVARTLTAWTGLGDLVHYEVASALDLPFEDASFEVATQLHVGMNIAHKASLFGEVSRVVVPGGRFGLYDVMRMSPGEHAFPVPWAGDATSSFLGDVGEYRRALHAAGFEIVAIRDRSAFARAVFASLGAAARGASPPLGLHLILGPQAPTKVAHMVAAFHAGVLAPVEIVCHKPVR
jgi:SAM-dependent methyltransferase